RMMHEDEDTARARVRVRRRERRLVPRALRVPVGAPELALVAVHDDEAQRTERDRIPMTARDDGKPREDVLLGECTTAPVLVVAERRDRRRATRTERLEQRVELGPLLVRPAVEDEIARERDERGRRLGDPRY